MENNGQAGLELHVRVTVVCMQRRQATSHGAANEDH